MDDGRLSRWLALVVSFLDNVKLLSVVLPFGTEGLSVVCIEIAPVGGECTAWFALTNTVSPPDALVELLSVDLPLALKGFSATEGGLAGGGATACVTLAKTATPLETLAQLLLAGLPLAAKGSAA